MRLRPPVPRPDGEAGRRPDRRAVAGHLDRPEGRLAQPALDGRDRHRDLRPPAPAVRADRHPALPQRPRRSSARPSSRSSTRSWPCPEGTRLLVLGPLIKDRKTEGDRVFDGARRQGFVRVRVDGEMYDIADGAQARQVQAPLDRGRRRPLRRPPRRGAGGRRSARADGRPIDPETGEAIPDPDAARLADSVETALRLGEGVVLIAPAPRDGEAPDFEERRYSEKYSCPYDGFTIDELEPRSFSFNSPHGACPGCTGLGHQARDRPRPGHPGPLEEPGRPARSCRGRRCRPTRRGGSRSSRPSARPTAGTTTAPIRDLPAEAIDYLLYAAKDEKVVVRYRHERGENTYKATFEGVVTNLERRYRETDSDYIKTELEKYMVTRPCPTCGGKRLRPEILAVTIGDRNVWDVSTMSITDALRWATGLGATLDRARADDRLPGPQGDRRPARLPRRRRARLPDPRPDQRDAVGRRGPADPPRDPDRDDADGRPVHPRRAVDRAPPARQREAHRDPDAAARPRQHGPRRRARRGDHPDRRLGRRHRARGRRARWRDHRQRVARGGARASRARSPARSCAASAPCRSRPSAGRGNGKTLRVKGAREHNLRERRPAGAARDVHRGHRRVGQRQEHARHRGPLPRPRARAQRVARARRRARHARGRRSTSTRSSRSTRARSAGRRARTRPRTRACSPRSASCSPACRSRASAATRRAASASTSRAAAARTARATASSRSRCSSCPTSTSRARSARASATTARRSRSTTRASRSPTSSR